MASELQCGLVTTNQLQEKQNQWIRDKSSHHWNCLGSWWLAGPAIFKLETNPFLFSKLNGPLIPCNQHIPTSRSWGCIHSFKTLAFKIEHQSLVSFVSVSRHPCLIKYGTAEMRNIRVRKTWVGSQLCHLLAVSGQITLLLQPGFLTYYMRVVRGPSLQKHFWGLDTTKGGALHRASLVTVGSTWHAYMPYLYFQNPNVSENWVTHNSFDRKDRTDMT